MIDKTCLIDDNALVESLLKGEIMRVKELMNRYHVRQTNDGRWYANINGRQVRKTKYEDIIKEISRPSTISGVWGDFIAARAENVGLSEDTVDKDIYWWKTYISKSDLSKIPIDKIRVSDLKRFYQFCCNEHGDLLKRKYWNGIIGTVSKIFQYCIDLDMMSINPVRSLKLDKNSFKPETVHDFEDLCFSETEKQMVIEQAVYIGQRKQDPIYCGIPLMFSIGPRLSEFNGLKWGDIKGDRIYITKSCTNGGVNIQNRTKTPSGQRYIPLTDEDIKAFETIKKLNVLKGYPVEDDAFIFYRTKKGVVKKCTNRCFDARLRTIQKGLGFEHIRSSHDIRRTFCTDLLSIPELSVRDVQTYMGHKTPQQTMEYQKIKDKQRSDDIFRKYRK